MSATSSPSNPHFSVVTAPGTPGLLVRTPVLRPSDGAADEARNTGGGHPHRSQQEGIENEQVSKIPPATANKSRTSNDFVIFETSTGKKVNIRGSDKMCRFLTGIPEASRTRADPAIKFPLRLMYVIECGDYNDYITWAPDNISFLITDEEQFEKVVLPEIFKDSKFESFLRKLYRWNFFKVKRERVKIEEGKCILKTKMGRRKVYLTKFSHPQFKAGDWTLVRSIKCRKRHLSKREHEQREEKKRKRQDDEKMANHLLVTRILPLVAASRPPQNRLEPPSSEKKLEEGELEKLKGFLEKKDHQLSCPNLHTIQHQPDSCSTSIASTRRSGNKEKNNEDTLLASTSSTRTSASDIEKSYQIHQKQLEEIVLLREQNLRIVNDMLEDINEYRESMVQIDAGMTVKKHHGLFTPVGSSKLPTRMNTFGMKNSTRTPLDLGSMTQIDAGMMVNRHHGEFTPVTSSKLPTRMNTFGMKRNSTRTPLGLSISSHPLITPAITNDSYSHSGAWSGMRPCYHYSPPPDQNNSLHHGATKRGHGAY